MMNPVPWLQMTNMISYQGLVRTFLSMMSKTEIFLLIILAVVLLGSIWFIFSDEIWLLLCYLESQIFPTFSVPE